MSHIMKIPTRPFSFFNLTFSAHYYADVYTLTHSVYTLRYTLHYFAVVPAESEKTEGSGGPLHGTHDQLVSLAPLGDRNE